jgi:hypothetical protein
MATPRQGPVSSATCPAMLGFLHNPPKNSTPDLLLSDSPHAWARAPRFTHPIPLPVRALGHQQTHHASTLVGCKLGAHPYLPTLWWAWDLVRIQVSLVGFRGVTLVLRWYSPPGFLSRDEWLCSGVQSRVAVPSASGDSGYAARRQLSLTGYCVGHHTDICPSAA